MVRVMVHVMRMRVHARFLETRCWMALSLLALCAETGLSLSLELSISAR